MTIMDEASTTRNMIEIGKISPKPPWVVEAMPREEAIAHLEQSLRDKDDIIQSQYAELASTRHRLDQAVDMLNEMRAELDRRNAA